MPSQVTKYKIVVSSPSDIIEELDVVSEVIDYWNITNSDDYGAMLEPVSWKTHATSEIGDRPQAIINKQLELEDCDILVAIFWTRLGTPTGEAESGTIEEIEEFRKVGKPVSIYFSSIPVSPKNIDIEQYKRLSEIIEKYKNDGLVIDYNSIEQFRSKLLMDIPRKIKLIRKATESSKKEKIHFNAQELDIPETYSKISEFPRSSIFHLHPSIGREVVDSPIVFQSVGGRSDNKGKPPITAATILPRVYDERQQPPIGSVHLPFYKWDAQNFEGFFYDLNNGLGAERLTILSIDGRTIKQGKLVYQTNGQPRMLKVAENGHTVGIEKFGAGDMCEIACAYNIVGWQGKPYVGIKNKSYKLVKLILEQGNATSEKKVLTVGETWDIGGGWQLTANSIDAKAIPRQAWLTLSKDGIKKDDKVVAQGNVYTYVEKSIGGESDVPLFVTYVDSIFVGATSDLVQLRYTWALDTSITEIVGGDRFGVFTVESVEPIQLYNTDASVILSEGIVDLMGDLKFKVADNPKFLRFHPIVLRGQ